jgi:hypothetical protein
MAQKRKKPDKPTVRVTPSNTHLWQDRTPENTPIVAVKWRDIQGIDNWNEDDEVAPARNCHTIGYLLYEGPDPKDKAHDMTVIASWYIYDEDEWSHYVVFPSEVIKEIVKLRGVK